ncbi:MAG TPA: ABC transporter permease [Bryobacteraceae bacterium]|nr:ABC transporter permease [Bryobacteraceae bacterium]
MNALWKDLRFAARVLAKSPGFTLVVVLSLALGIGANTAVFSLVNAMLLRPMPVDQPDRLVAIYLTSPHWGSDIRGFSYPDLLDYRKADTGLAELMGSTGIPLSVTDNEKPELIWGEIVTGNYFAGLGVHPVLGRTFLPEEDRAPGQKPVCVLSYNFWREHFASDPKVAGKTIRLNGHTFTIAGVAPRGFIGTTLLNFIPDVWVPVMMQKTIAPNQGDYLEGRGNRWISLRARLKPGVSMAQAQSAMNLVANRLAAEYPQTNRDLHVNLIPGGARTQPFLVASGLVSATTVTMFGVVALVLLIACSNVANLMLARAASRAREMAIRVAVGASRFRLVRQLLTESVLLSVMAAALAIGLAFWFNELLKDFYPSLDFQTADLDFQSRPDPRVFVFSFALSLVTAVLFGLAPALRASKAGPASAIKGESAAPTDGFRRYTRGNALVMAQVALSFVLLISGALFLRSMQFARSVSPGFDRTGIQLFSVDLNLQNYAESRGRVFEKELVDRLQQIPGVESASLAYPLPLDAYGNSAQVSAEGYVPRSDNENHTTALSLVGPRYFETMGTRLVAGRPIEERDSESSRRVAVINEAMAGRYWQSPEKALGRRFSIWDEKPIEVVGVAKNGKYESFGEAPLPYFFLPLAQHYSGRITFLVRSKENPETLMPSVRQEVRTLDATLPIFGVRTMPQFLNRTVSVYEMGASLVGTFALVALLLAAVGIYGVLHFGVTRRTREIGIRMALGASRSNVLRLVLARSMIFVAAGLALGIAGAVAAGRLTGTILAGVSPTDPLTFLGVAVLFTAVALAASAIPARRASHIDPMEAVRYE